jgi:hypothetical protein
MAVFSSPRRLDIPNTQSDQRNGLGGAQKT